ncbi:MAG: ATP-binding protein [Frankiaceae bacterium]|nr:ATP-binding protein [Frankiaceae bacterium]
MPTAAVTLPASVSSVPTARHFVESILTSWGLESLAWTATLITSELATNAALHARGTDFGVRVTADDQGARIEVDDASRQLPQQRSYSEESTTGRGLRLVAELAHEWGVTPGPAGKTVWVVLRPDSGTGDEQDDDVESLLSTFSDGDVITLADRLSRPDATARRRLTVAE